MSYQPFTELPENAVQQTARRKPLPTSTYSSPPELPSPALQLQRTLGNQRVGELIQAQRLTPEGGIIGFQPKLTVGAANDQYEQEADHVARQVMSMPESAAANPMQRASPQEEDKDKMLQTKPLAASITPFVQRQTERNEEPEEKGVPVRAKLLNGTNSSSLQRQSVTDENEMEASGSHGSIQRTCAACEATNEQQS
jgi:hypothetical protein